MTKRHLIFPLIALILCAGARAQQAGRFSPIYFIGGAQLGQPLSNATADLKYAFNVSYTAHRDIGGCEGLNLDLVYTQVSVWNFFLHSSPFRDTAYIPAVYLTIPCGKDLLTAGLEHRSNGRADEVSRSATYLFGRYEAFLDGALSLGMSVRAGIGWYDSELTQEIYRRFLGYADLLVGYSAGRLEAALTATPVFGPFGVNITAETSYALGACSIFVQLTTGYADSMADWIRGYRPPARLRLGVMIGPLSPRPGKQE